MSEIGEAIALQIMKFHDWNYMNSTEPNHCPDGYCTCIQTAAIARGTEIIRVMGMGRND